MAGDDYNKLVRELRNGEPERLYLLYGDEDYLVERFFEALREACGCERSDAFNYSRFTGGELDPDKLSDAVDTLPFFTGRTLVELRGVDINKMRDRQAEQITAILSDIPDYCTVVIIPGLGFSPDKRLKLFSAIKKQGRVVEFQAQSTSSLVNWIIKRAQTEGITAGRAEAERLIFISGGLMSRIIPELDKLCAYTGDGKITLADIDEVCDRLPEADVFEITEQLALQDYDGALALLSQLIQKRESPIMLLAIIGQQFRRLYAARAALERSLSREEAMKLCGVRHDFILRKLYKAAEKYSLRDLREALLACAEADMAMKSSSAEDDELLTGLVLRLAVIGDEA